MMMTHPSTIPDGKYTLTVYTLIKDGRFQDVIRLMKNELGLQPRNRAGLSLLAYSYYQIQEFALAADTYEKLSKFYPDIHEYRLYYAQALYKSAQYQAAQKACHSIAEAQEFGPKILKLQAAIKYDTQDLSGCKMLIDQLSLDDPDTLVNLACFAFKEGRYEEAISKYTEALKRTGQSPELSYYIALCYYQMKQYNIALKYIADIIEKGIREHPELNVGLATEGLDTSSVGNSKILHETFLVEAFNLKGAIEYNVKNIEAAREALSDMPPRKEEELDPVTLHNLAITTVDENPAGSFEKLSFLLSQTPCPPEAFMNLVLLYIKHEYYDVAADILAENGPQLNSKLPQHLSEYFDALLLKQTSPEASFEKLDDLANRMVDSLRKLTKKVQDAREKDDEGIVRDAIEQYDITMERYIPVLMAQAKIYWDAGNYAAIEKLFRRSVEFCNENETWKLNVAHVLFMQEAKYKEAISFYEPIVKRNYEKILDVTAIVLANLCVSYIMTSQNEQAEEIMRKIEKEEERAALENPNKRLYHLCIVNLVIGTLYCAKGNYEFGISRVMKSLEPFDKKLGTDTWFYAKRCFVSLFEALAKQLIIIKDGLHQEILEFFDNCENFGREIPASVELLPLDPDAEDDNKDKNTVSYEARLLKSLFLRLYD